MEWTRGIWQINDNVQNLWFKFQILDRTLNIVVFARCFSFFTTLMTVRQARMKEFGWLYLPQKTKIKSPTKFHVEWLVDVQRTTIDKCNIFDFLDNIVQINLKFYSIGFTKYIFMFYNIFIYQNCHTSVATVNYQMLSLHSIMVHIISKSWGVIHLNQIVI